MVVLLFGDGEVCDREIARHQIPIVFRIEHRPLHIVAREALIASSDSQNDSVTISVRSPSSRWRI
jgi:hypothetical protein